MKTNLKNFPDVHEYFYRKQVHDWKEAFEKELHEKLVPAVLNAMAELYDNRSDFQKGWKMGYVTCLREILGEEGEGSQ